MQYKHIKYRKGHMKIDHVTLWLIRVDSNFTVSNNCFDSREILLCFSGICQFSFWMFYGVMFGADSSSVGRVNRVCCLLVIVCLSRFLYHSRFCFWKLFIKKVGWWFVVIEKSGSLRVIVNTILLLAIEANVNNY